MPRSKKKAIQTTMKLSHLTRKIAELVGNGDRTAGVERLMANLPLFYRLKVYLEKRSADGDQLAEALLLDMEKLEIDRVYQGAITEGAIELPDGSWIV